MRAKDKSKNKSKNKKKIARRFFQPQATPTQEPCPCTAKPAQKATKPAQKAKRNSNSIMNEPQKVPQLTELGESLAQDDERKYLEVLLERLSDKTNFAPSDKPKVEKPTETPLLDSRQEAVKSARHILQAVWSMQHLDKLAKEL